MNFTVLIILTNSRSMRLFSSEIYNNKKERTLVYLKSPNVISIYRLF